ncbi:Septal ring factor EnvC, activator of murein hydrolases AmiA and AmiB [Caloramator fervidus]|uniref:Septal ring factor EnvC, activator of murein hydrolases AmiA and AmiB n=1 Tax=Caloramator fervidus TaxID=29344 RepID=A0A1H5TB89_9CLOT|nr:M23 family metallopeptidase [Caloramator fervidus]SEF60142.1 Septal ring factor EnvC, activator of murein hydrolases AmiA and AmiB [Caloramator fervidus]
MRKIALFLTFILFFTTFTVKADELTKKKQQLKEVKSNIENLKDKIDDIKDEKQEVMKKIKEYESKVTKIQNEIDDINYQISQKKEEIKKTNKELEKAVEEFESEKDLYGKRLRALYMEGNIGYLDVLLASESFSDFISNYELFNRIIDYDKNLLKEMKKKQEEIKAKKEALERQQMTLLALQKEQMSKKYELSQAVEEQRGYYKKLQENQNELERLLDEELQESKRLEAQIKQLQAELAKRSGGSRVYSGSKTGIIKVSDIGYVPRVTSYFGYRFHPILQKWKMHTGIDIAVPTGTPIYAMSDGEVIIAQYLNGYGYTVVIDHGGGVTSLYAHLSRILVYEGQKVEKGDMIAKSGSTGYSTGPHLHFEVRINGEPVNPEPYYIVGQ